MKKLFAYIKALRVQRFLNSLYHKERADFLLYVEKSDNFPVTMENSVKDTYQYCFSLSLRKIKEIRKQSSKYWLDADIAKNMVEGEKVSFTLPKGFDPVFALSISRKLDDPGMLGIHSINTDQGNYIPVDLEQIAMAIAEASNDLKNEKAEIEKSSNGS